MSTNDGGPAFPTPAEIDCDGLLRSQPSTGMSLRDWFAGQALAGMCSPLEDGSVYPPTYQASDFEPWPEGESDDAVWYESGGHYSCGFRSRLRKGEKPLRLTVTYHLAIAREAYRFADAMLAARNTHT